MNFIVLILNSKIIIFKDAWGALSLYIKEHDRFPQPFIEWFDSIFQIYQTKNEYDEKVASFECLLRLFIISGADDQMAVESYNTVTAVSCLEKNLMTVLLIKINAYGYSKF